MLNRITEAQECDARNDDRIVDAKNINKIDPTGIT